MKNTSVYLYYVYQNVNYRINDHIKEITSHIVSAPLGDISIVAVITRYKW